MASKQLVWLITGTTSGFGRELALAALQRGDKVIATARDVSKVDALMREGAETLQLDVTDSLNNLKRIANSAVDIHGRVDVLVNNAGYIALGALEELTPEETLRQYNTNVFGALNVTRAFLPFMREQKTGTIVFLGSIAGWIGGPVGGLYSSTKYAIRGIAESLNTEVSPLGLKVHCIEPGYFRTSFLNTGNRGSYEPSILDYEPTTRPVYEGLLQYDGRQPGDPKKLARIVLDVVRGEGVAAGRGVPVTLPLGSDALGIVGGSIEDTRKVLDNWKDVIKSTDLPADA